MVPGQSPRVSIGLPVFNGENYLGAAIESILSQTYTDFELIVSDNASTDATEEIVQRYAEADRRVRYYRSAQNRGASANFNKTFELSSGEYFKWAAHDDLLASTYLEKCVAALDREADAVLAQPLVGVIDGDGALLGIADNELQLAGAPSASARFAAVARYPRHCWEAFGLIRRDALARTPLIAPYSWSDLALCAELALLGRFVLVPEPLFFNRDHSARYSRTALLDRQASWQWWCRPGGRTSGVADLCPMWRLQLRFRHMIREHVADRRERRRAYLWLLGHVVSWPTLSRLIVEPITAIDPRVLAAGRRIKRWLRARRVPSLRLTAGPGHPRC